MTLRVSPKKQAENSEKKQPGTWKSPNPNPKSGCIKVIKKEEEMMIEYIMMTY